MKVLVLDDSRTMRYYIEKIVVSMGHEVAIFEKAEDALREIERSPNFNLLILDWMLPGEMDGLELCKRVRCMPGGDACLIVVITSRDKDDDLNLVLEAGADDYIAKPVNENLLRTRLRVAESMAFNLMERKRMEAQLRASLAEKELLMREIHHRVKNNLMTISSLLGLQSREISDQRAKGAFTESQGRVRAMSMIHERLYGRMDFTSLDLPDYIESLAVEIFRSNSISTDKIELTTEIDPIELDVDSIVPLGLILNELITNSLKHAFPDGRSGQLQILCTKAGDGTITLTARDNGAGFPPGVNVFESESLGMRIVNSLIEQLEASASFVTDGWTGVTIAFKEASIE